MQLRRLKHEYKPMTTINSSQFTVHSKKRSAQQGFTLIELLVVIAIIAVLASFIMSNFIAVRQRARDGQRKSNVGQVQAALEVYRADVGSYPSTANFPTCGNALSFGKTTYIPKVPCDPLNTSTGYTYTSGGTTYSIIACLENSNDPEIDKDGSGNKVNCGSSTTQWQRTFENP